jgi:DNA repair exonuclease SbcCD nuclease subunit
MRIAILGDVHIGARTDSQIFNEYFIRFFEEQFIPFLLEHKITTVIQLGDIFDRRKFVNFQILNTWKRRVFDVFRDNGILVYILLGNHDVYYRNTNEVNSPSLLLGEYENINIIETPTERKFGTVKTLLMPWITYSTYQDSVNTLNTTKCSIVMGHFDIQGFEMYRGHVSTEGLTEDIFAKFKAVYSGHYHTMSKKGNIAYLGIPYEITWMDWNDPKGFHLWDTASGNMQFIPNPLKIFHKVYYDDSKEQFFEFEKYTNTYVKVVVVNKKNIYMFDKFMSELYAVNPADLKIVENIADYDSNDFSEEVEIEDTKSLMYAYVDGMEIAEDKERIKDILNTLFVEALQVEEA